MSRIKEIEDKIKIMGDGEFQAMCDDILYRSGYEEIVSLGSHSGSNNTTIGIPDTYFKDAEGNYIFVAYTAQKTGGVFSKIKRDIEDCINKSKQSGVSLKEIIYCHISSNININQDKELIDLCRLENVNLTLYGINKLSHLIDKKFPIVGLNYLGLNLDSEQIFYMDDFIKDNDKNKVAAPLSIKFIYADNRVNDILENLDNKDAVLISGAPGTGKTKLALESSNRFLEKNNIYKLFCIKDNQIDLYEDLNRYFGVSDTYLIIVDDANSISNLKHVLKYLNKDAEGYKVKMILTVRDYAKDDVIKTLKQFCDFNVYNLGKMSDDGLREMLENQFDINNKKIIESILKNANGNLRTAVIAGKAYNKSKSNISEIENAEQIYENYYDEIIKNITGNDDAKIKILGIISFFDNLKLENNRLLENILEKENISFSNFNNYLIEFHNKEILDMIPEKITKFSDQNMQNYILYYAFKKEKKLSLSYFIENFYSNNSKAMIEAINTLVTVYNSKDMFEFIEAEVNNVWNCLTNESEKEVFLNFFYRIKEIESIKRLNEKINTIEKVQYLVTENDYNEEKKFHDENEYLKILGDFGYSNNIDVVFDLILKYYNKRPDLYNEVVYCLTNAYNVDKFSLERNYYNQIRLTNRLFDYLKNNNNNNNNLLVLKVIKHFIQLVFKWNSSDSERTLTLYTIPLILTEELKKNREQMWKYLLEIYNNQNYKKIVRGILTKYIRYGDKVDLETLKYDSIFLKKFIDEKFDKKNIDECLIIDEILRMYSFHKIDFKFNKKALSTNTTYLLYKVFKENSKADYLIRKQNKKNELSKYIEDFNLNDYEVLFSNCVLLSNSDIQDYEISSAINMIFEIISNKVDLFKNVVELYLKMQTPFDIHPSFIIEELVKKYGYIEIEKLINSYDYRTKNYWQFSLISQISKESISRKSLEKIYAFFDQDENNVVGWSRRLDFLDDYMKIDNGVFAKVMQKILKKSDFVFSLYSTPLFNHYATEPEVLYNRFNNNTSILKELYFRASNLKELVDYNGKFISHFITKDISFLDNFINHILITRKTIAFRLEGVQLSILWDLKDFEQYINYIQNKYLVSDSVSLRDKNSLFDSLIREKKSSVDNTDLWIKSLLEKFNNSINIMQPLFDSLVELPDSRLKEYIILFLSLNSNFEVFKELSLEAHHLSWYGSMVPLCKSKIDFFESILPYTDGLEYINHKVLLMEIIDKWKNNMKREEISDFED